MQPGCDGMLFHPHLLGEFAPQWNPNLRASFTGVTIHHGRPHLTRSILEGVAFQVRAALEDLREAGATWNEIRLIGGGAASPL
ncbi:MAG: FGGY-family carbohydrate kinase [Truepera sp.]|nr:FGGY-family carbohydrate kinase [Truepera sp.]